MRTIELQLSIGLFGIALLGGCPWQHRIPHFGSKPPRGETHECRADHPVEAYTACTCGDAPADPGPGDFCSPPQILYERVCLIDSDCNAYPFNPEIDALEPDTNRDDIAIRWEFAQPLPPDANLALNAPPAHDASRMMTPFSLYGTKDPTDDDIAPEPGPDTWIDAEVRVSADRKAVTIVPKQRCLEGPWLLRSEIWLDLIYGRDDVCGEPDNLGLGYSASFTIE